MRNLRKSFCTGHSSADSTFVYCFTSLLAGGCCGSSAVRFMSGSRKSLCFKDLLAVFTSCYLTAGFHAGRLGDIFDYVCMFAYGSWCLGNSYFASIALAAAGCCDGSSTGFYAFYHTGFIHGCNAGV